MKARYRQRLEHVKQDRLDARTPIIVVKQTPGIVLMTIVLMIIALLATSCAASLEQQGAPAPSPGSERVFVEALLTSATADERSQWADKSFEQIGAIVASSSRVFVSSPHVLIAQGQRATMKFPSDRGNASEEQLIQYEVLAQKGEPEDQLKLHIKLEFENGETAKTLISTDPHCVVITLLENGFTLVVQAETISSQPELQRIYERKVRAAEAERDSRGPMAPETTPSVATSASR